VSKDRDGLHGKVRYQDTAANRTFTSTKITTLIINGSHATITGSGKVNGSTVPFTVDVEDRHPDTFKIQWPGYSASGAVTGEGVDVDREECEED
jgi:hypothetical protein